MKTEQQYDAQAMKLLLVNGYDVKHALQIKDQYMHLYLKEHNHELYDAMEDGKKSCLDFYLEEEKSFYEFVKDKLESDLENRCCHYVISRGQLVDEVCRDQGISGTQGFRNNGCFSCDGHTDTCDRYISMKMLE